MRSVDRINPRIRAAQREVLARAVEDARVVAVWRRLEKAGIRPILIKGWSAARLYANPARRSLGDIDLCFATEELSAALAMRQASPRDFALADFHEGIPDLPDRTWEELFARSELVTTEDVTLRVLAREEHLRLTCRHLARHGAAVPKMLEDVSAILASLPAEFDWDECLRGDPHTTRWVLAIVGLAERLLGAPIRDPRIRALASCPDWLADIVPRIWNAGRAKHSLVYYLRRPREAVTALRWRYLNPVRASFQLGSLPQKPWQVVLLLLRYFAFRRAATIVTSPLARLVRGGPKFRADVHVALRACESNEVLFSSVTCGCEAQAVVFFRATVFVTIVVRRAVRRTRRKVA